MGGVFRRELSVNARDSCSSVRIHTIVRGRRVQVMVDGRQTVDYTEPVGSATRLTGGTIALQGHDPGSEVHYENIMIRPL